MDQILQHSPEEIFYLGVGTGCVIATAYMGVTYLVIEFIRKYIHIG